MTRTRKRAIFVTLASFLCASMAQVAMSSSTSASLSGHIRSADGNPISGAAVTIVHEPSGTTSTASSGDTGSFFQSGLRVGGPYTIKISAAGYLDAEIGDVDLRPGLQPGYEITLQVSGSVEEVVVVGSRSGQLHDLHNGIGSSYTARDIANHPSTDQDAIRTLLRDPLAHSEGEGHLSVAGVNPRFNGFAIDGSLQQDDFGLGENTYATERSPISLDAIESLSLVASDYSTDASGFTGGLVNVTTKSGGNDWGGSAFFYVHNDGFIGDTYDGDRDFNPGTFDENEYGFTVGGPVIPNTLFFFASVDQYESTETRDFRGFDEGAGIQPGFFEAMRGFIRDTYGYDPGGRPDIASTPVTSERTLLKADWNINPFHRASFTYQSTVESGTGSGASRFESSWIDVPVDLTAETIQLFSDWTDTVSTNIRLNRKTFSRGQNCRAGPGVGAMEIDDIRGSDLEGTPLAGLITGTVDLDAGCDRFRHANAYNDERLQVYGAVNYVVGDHIVHIGAEYETFDLFNLFVPSSAGRFVFDGFEDLANRRARVDYVNTVTNNAQDGAAAWGFAKRTFLLQDTWQAQSDLEVTYGIRLEQYVQDDRPTYSQEIRDQYGVRTDKNLDGMMLVMPRLSFRYTGHADTVVSGGIGRFSGGDPKVWTSNTFQVPTVFSRLSGAENVSPTSVPAELIARVGATAAGLPIDFIANDFQPPSDWKVSLKVDRYIDELKLWGVNLGSEYEVSAQYLFTYTHHGFVWTNLAQTDLFPYSFTGVAPDGRTIYADLDANDQINLTQLGNHNEGGGQIVSVAIARPFRYSIDAAVSYAYQSIDTVTEGFSSRGISNWRNITDSDRNRPSARNSPHEVSHAYKINVGWETTVAGVDLRADLFGRAATGDRYLFSYDIGRTNSLFGRAGAGESPYDNSPIYIPTSRDDPAVVYGSNFDTDAFFAYIEEHDIPSGIFEPYSAHSGWNRTWDFRLQGSIQGFMESRVKFVLDIDNVLNFLNDSWGVHEGGPRFNQAPIVRADLVTRFDVDSNGVDDASALTNDLPRTRCFNQQSCVYRYNTFVPRDLSFPNATRSVYRIRLGFRIEL